MNINDKIVLKDKNFNKAALEGDVQECLPPRYRPYVSVLSDLQILHDDTNPNQWKDGLQRIANKHHLKIPKL